MDKIPLITYPDRRTEALAARQKDIMRIMVLLSGKRRYESVDAAINAAGVTPESVYMSIVRGERTMTLDRFYEALGTAF